MNSPIRIMVYSEPGLLRDSIFTILTSFSGVNISGMQAGAFPGGLDEIGQVRPDLILVDCGPQYTHSDFIHSLKAALPQIKCVAIADNLSCRELALKYGVDYVLMKGFTSRELKSIVQEVVSGRTETTTGDS